MRYFNKAFGIPRTVAEGRVLAHNHVMHTIDMGYGVDGFRCWTWPADKVPLHFTKCPCGWSGLPHVADRDHVRASKGKCITQYELLRISGFTPADARAAIRSGEDLRTRWA